MPLNGYACSIVYNKTKLLDVYPIVKFPEFVAKCKEASENDVKEFSVRSF